MRPKPSSEVAREIAALKERMFGAVRDGRPVPPLLWTLFSRKVRNLKEKKRAERLLKELLSGIS